MYSSSGPCARAPDRIVSVVATIRAKYRLIMEIVSKILPRWQDYDSQPLSQPLSRPLSDFSLFSTKVATKVATKVECCRADLGNKKEQRRLRGPFSLASALRCPK